MKIEEPHNANYLEKKHNITIELSTIRYMISTLDVQKWVFCSQYIF